MLISYDPQKSWRNFWQRGLSFHLVQEMQWNTAQIKPDLRFNYPEPRFIATGYLSNTHRLHIVCFTPTSEGIRVISFRKANKREIKKYESETAFNR